MLELLNERFDAWQESGFIPRRAIEPGQKTTEPIRTRGWTHWHQLFAPRQLLTHGLFLSEFVDELDVENQVVGMLGIGRSGNWNSRMTRWDSGVAKELVNETFYNQALNTMDNFGVKGLTAFTNTWFVRTPCAQAVGDSIVVAGDARRIHNCNEYWITDPPYADAVNYHELGEFFLSLYEKRLPDFFPDWSRDSRRLLAVKGGDPIEFRRSMVDCYSNLVEHMPDDGMQVVMFTHQDASVWADLTTILWASGLRVTAAWCIATETDSATKNGNYVQGTVLLVCRKRTDDDPVFLDEINHRVEEEVRQQLSDMLALDDDSEPNFGDADYQLAA